MSALAMDYDFNSDQNVFPAIYKEVPRHQQPKESYFLTSPYWGRIKNGTAIFHLESVLPKAFEQVSQIEKAFGVNRSQLAVILRTTRKTIYDWDKGAEPARPDIIVRLIALSKVAASMPDDGMGTYVGKNIRRPIVGSLSLLDILSSDELDKIQIVEALKVIRPLAEGSKSRIEAHATRKLNNLSKSESQATLDHFSPRS